MFYQILFLPQVKRIATISNKHGINEFFDNLSNDLRLVILAKKKRTQKPQNLTEL